MKQRTTLALALLLVISVHSYTPQCNVNQPSTRGNFIKVLVGVAGASSQVIFQNPQIVNAAAVEKAEGNIIGSGGKCAYGVGDGCDELSEGNEFIKELQRKSSKSKEAAQKEYLSAYQMKNYPDFFASLNPPKYMVKQPDGSIKLYEDQELTELKKAGKIRLERPMAMGGQVVDITQKPILVLVE